DRWPMTENGKIDRKALLEVEPARARAAGPLSATERRIADIFGDLLETKFVDPEIDFIEQGGDSILAIRLLRRLRADLGLNLTLAQLLQAPTVRRLATMASDE